MTDWKYIFVMSIGDDKKQCGCGHSSLKAVFTAVDRPIGLFLFGEEYVLSLQGQSRTVRYSLQNRSGKVIDNKEEVLAF